MPRNLWCIVAAGDRVSSSRQKQVGCGSALEVPGAYSLLGRTKSLIEESVERARAITDLERIVPVVLDEHRVFWQEQLACVPATNLVVQPRASSSAVALLLPLLKIAARDPQGIVVVLPTHHSVDESEVMIRAIEAAAEGVERSSERILLLGVLPTEAQTAGWIVPNSREAGLPFHGVDAFIDRPGPRMLRLIAKRGGLHYTGLLAAVAETLLQAYVAHLPELLLALSSWQNSAWDRSAWGLCPADLPARDFAADILEPSAHQLGVILLPPCGYAEMVTPASIRRLSLQEETVFLPANWTPTLARWQPPA